MPKIRKSVKDCVNAIKKGSSTGDITDEQAQLLLSRIDTLGQQRAKKNNQNIEVALREIKGEIIQEERLLAQIDRRNRLLQIQRNRINTGFVNKFIAAGMTAGDGVRALLEGSNFQIQGARFSIDYQAKAANTQYFGRMFAELEEAGVLNAFRTDKLGREIYIELGELGKEGGKLGRSGSPEAAKIAKIVHGITDEMVTRQNRAGAYIRKLPGYVTRQIHDREALRRLGTTQQESFDTWFEFILPLLDIERTAQGFDSKAFLRKVHQNLYNGKHAPSGRDVDNLHSAELDGFSIQGSLSKKISSSRVLHFKDAEAAFEYNQKFGSRDIKDGILQDILNRSRSIALMENLGPNPEAGLKTLIRNLEDTVEARPDSAKQVDSLRQKKITWAFDLLTGKNDIPENVGISRFASLIRTSVITSKLGGVMLTSLGDKAFMVSELFDQGIRDMGVLTKQVTGLLPRSTEQKQMLKLMGVGLDSLLGHTMLRYSYHAKLSGFGHKMQNMFFGVSGMNWWNSANKASVGELMAANMGENAGLKWNALDVRMRETLELYNVGSEEWNAMRSMVYTNEMGTFITADTFKDIDTKLLNGVIKKRGLKSTTANRARVARDLVFVL